MRRLATPALVLLTVAALALAALSLGRALALFTNTASVPANTFTTAASFEGCTAGNTGFLNPTAEAADTGGDGDGFELDPTDAFADGGGYATNNEGPGDRHRFYDYGFSIPGACAIRGIEVRLDWWLDSASGTNSISVQLSWDGGTSWTAAKTDDVESLSEHTVTLGASVDRWGRTWSLADFSDANFRVRLTSNGTSGPRDFFLDWVPIKVHYGNAIQTSGFLSPSAEAFDTGGDGDGFELNPTNAFADGGGYAEDSESGSNFATTCNTTVRDRHRYYDYGFTIPAGSAIQGIEVRLDAWADSTSWSPFICAELSWDGGTTWTAFRSSPTLATSEATFIVGGEADDWGRTWDASGFSDANFRVRITNVANIKSRDFFLDWLPIQVYYDPP